MTFEIRQTVTYYRDQVVQFLELTNDDIARNPENYPTLTAEDRAMWAGFPAQARAHPFPQITFAASDTWSIVQLMKSGRIGPRYGIPKSTTKA